MIKKSLLIFTCFSLSIADSFAYTIYDAIVSAHENNNDAIARVKELQSVKMNRPIAYSGFLPTVNFSATSLQQTIEGGVGDGTKTNSANRTLTITQPIYNGGGTLSSIGQAESQIDASYYAFMAFSYDLSQRVVAAYEGVDYARAASKLAEENVILAKRSLEFAQIRFKYGDTTKTDVYNSEAYLAQGLADKEKADSDLVTAIANFEYITGSILPKDMEPILIDDSHVPNSVAELTKLALVNNPNIKASTASAQMARYKVGSVVSGMLPSVSAYAQYQKSNQDNTAYITPNYSQVGIQVSVPLFNAQLYPTVGQAKYDAEKARYSKYDVEEQIRSSSHSYWSEFISAKAMIQASIKAVQSYKLALEGTEEEARLGTKTILDLIDSQNRYYYQRLKLRNAEMSYKLAVYKILNLAGMIDTVDIKDINLKTKDD